MQNLTSTLSRLALAFTAALALGSCSRAEYATLPRSTPYLGSTPIAATRQTTPAPAAPLATEAVAVLPAPAAPVAPAAAPAPVAPSVAATPAVAAAPAAKASHKLNLVQHLALKKVTKRLDNLLAKAPQLKKHDATASTTRLDDNLRTGLLLILLGVLVSILAFVSNFFAVVGGIIALVGLVFIILWLLDQA